MPPRSSWKGFIRLSLVSVPVKAYTASASGAEIRLNQLHKETHNRIRYVKTDPERGEVRNEDIVSGYEYAKNQYVIIDPEEVQKLRPRGDQSVHVEGFVPTGTLDPVYFAGKNYYLVPDGPVGQKPYALLHRAMVEEDVVALAKVVISGRDQLVMLRPLENGMIAMAVLEHEAKVKSADAFLDELGDAQPTAEELKLAKTLVDASRIQDFDYAAYKDEYLEKLTQVIQAKVEGQEIVAVPDREEPKIINLMEALKASVAAARSGEAGPAPEPKKAASRKKAPSARKTGSERRKSG